MSENIPEYESAFNHGRNTEVVTKLIDGVTHVLIPSDASLKSMDHLLPAPRRIVANPEFYDVWGFADYANEFKSEGTRIFVNQADRRFFTIFDFHAPGVPAWGDHSASLEMRLSPEWRRWKDISGKVLSPIDMAEWLEDNMEYIIAPITGADLLSMAQNYKVKLKGDLTVEQSMQSGLRTLHIKDDSVLQGKSGAKEMMFPEQIELALRIFDNHDTYPVKVYLRYRTDKESVTFFFKVPDPERLEEQAFDLVVEKVAKTTKLKTLKGRFAGPRHK